MIDLEKMKLQAYRGSFTSGQALDLIEAYEALHSRLESLEKDAARWREVRDSDQGEVDGGWRPYITDFCPHDYYAPSQVKGIDADNLVDAAMQAHKGGE